MIRAGIIFFCMTASSSECGVRGNRGTPWPTARPVPGAASGREEAEKSLQDRAFCAVCEAPARPVASGRAGLKRCVKTCTCANSDTGRRSLEPEGRRNGAGPSPGSGSRLQPELLESGVELRAGEPEQSRGFRFVAGDLGQGPLDERPLDCLEVHALVGQRPLAEAQER